ncbi:DUF5065 family protein [Bacillus cereus]|nr:DUF5065 family protein [Bacillus cereus]
MKLGKLALVGALALGGFTGLAALDAKPTDAASNVQAASTTWNDPAKIYDVNQFAWDFPIYLADDVKPSYKTGDFFQVKMGWDNTMDGNPMKIYRIMDDYSLVCYQTMYPFPAYIDGVNQAVWYADITSAYEPGNYIALVKVGGNFYKSQWFTINK